MRPGFPLRLSLALLLALVAAPPASALHEIAVPIADDATHGCYRPAFEEVDRRERQAADLVNWRTLPYPLPATGPGITDVDARPTAEAILEDADRAEQAVVDAQTGTMCYVSRSQLPSGT